MVETGWLFTHQCPSPSREQCWTALPNLSHGYTRASIIKAKPWSINIQKWRMPFPCVMDKNFPTRLIMTCLLLPSEFLWEDNRAPELYTTRETTKPQNRGAWTPDPCSEGSCPLRGPESLLWISCKREINFYYVWGIMGLLFCFGLVQQLASS